jgi:hypothetical protein
MAAFFADWAGAERRFNLSFGQMMDLEEACDKTGIGAIYLRLGSHQYFARDIYHTIRMGLVGGGMSETEAHRLMKDRFDATPLIKSAEMAINILVNQFAGIDPGDTAAPRDVAEPLKAGPILASFLKAGIPPDAVRAMSYADFVNISRAIGGDGVEPPSEQEFADMVARLVKEPTDD